MIETDHHIGRVLDFLKTSGVDDNTLVVFTSDNGPEKSWPARIKDFDHDSRGGLKQGKRSVYEGGHRVPFLVRWPNGIMQPGRQWNKIVGQVDLLATFADLLGTELPATAGEDSQSFAAVLRNPDADYDRVPLITHGNGGKIAQRYAITIGDWKLIMPNQNNKLELYNLLEDRAEKNNVASANSERVAQMKMELNQIISRGRSTAGPAQPNDTKWWDDLNWMTKDEYRKLSKEN